MFVLSASASVATSLFQANTALFGGGLGSDCVSEICVGNLPRDTCAAQATNVTDTSFDLNSAGAGDGGGIHVANQGLNMAGALPFSRNWAERGACVFVALGVEVTGDDKGTVRDDGTNRYGMDTGYGTAIASPPTALTWTVGLTSPPRMPGENICDSHDCAINILDAYDNAPTTPTVVEVVNLTPHVVAVAGPQYVLVAAGSSEPIPSLSVRLAVAPTEVTGPVSIGLSFLDADVVFQPLTFSVAECELGYGLSDDGSVCEPCPIGLLSTVESWAPCSECDPGTTTGGVGEEVHCDWCAAGYGWDDADEGCRPCLEGEFAANATFREPCVSCPPGLTTDGDTATVCTVPTGAITAGFNPNVVVIIVTAVVGVAGAVALAVSCVRKRDARHGAIGTVTLSVRRASAALVCWGGGGWYL